jgi:hypothetical protein
MMQSEAEPSLEIERLREFAGREVRLRLADGSEHRGVLRTELLSEHSISVFIALSENEGATIYVDQIVEITCSN